jgi:hypothetical protein
MSGNDLAGYSSTTTGRQLEMGHFNPIFGHYGVAPDADVHEVREYRKEEPDRDKKGGITGQDENGVSGVIPDFGHYAVAVPFRRC